MAYILIYRNGDLSITKIIEADSQDKALDLILKMYEDYDIIKNEVDIMVHNDVKDLVNNFWEAINANR